MHVWNVLHADRWNTGRKDFAKNRHLRTIAQICRAISSQLRHTSTIGKNLLNGNISSMCFYNMVNFSPLTAEICWRVWGTRANFNGFRVLASLLQRRRSTEVNQTCARCLAVSCTGILCILGGSCPKRNFTICKIHFASKSCIPLYWQRYCTAVEQWA